MYLDRRIRTSIENELIMVTENVKEFERIKGIKIENWVKR